MRSESEIGLNAIVYTCKKIASIFRRCPLDDEPVPLEGDTCPFCLKSIEVGELKCKHCGSMLEHGI
jgi:hypothetical protein